jgi:5-methylcytosine-specific restriction endonuclease McrA
MKNQNSLTFHGKPCRNCGGTLRYAKAKKKLCVLCARASKERWRVKNLDKKRIINTKWRRNNPDRQSASEKLWRTSNPAAAKAKNIKQRHRRRARSKETSTVSVHFLRALRTSQDDKCAYCGSALYGAGELDHVTPVSKGGKHDENNLVWACMPCNRKKSDRTSWLPFSLLGNLQD